MLVDSHCHLDFADAAERPAIIARARRAGVKTMVTICTKLDEFPLVRAIAEADPDIWCTVGVHPHEAKEIRPRTASGITTNRADPGTSGRELVGVQDEGKGVMTSSDYLAGMQREDASVGSDDLIAAYLGAIEHPGETAGEVFNIGGGPANKLSILDLLAHLESVMGTKLDVSFEDWRPGDQKVFVADVRKAFAVFGWAPRISVPEGVARLSSWAAENIELLRRLLG